LHPWRIKAFLFGQISAKKPGFSKTWFFGFDAGIAMGVGTDLRGVENHLNLMRHKDRSPYFIRLASLSRIGIAHPKINEIIATYAGYFNPE